MDRARVFLLVFGALFLAVFAIPLFADPYWWADRFGWDTRTHTDLATYFGRCLGAVAIGITATAAWASRAPAEHRRLFDVIVIAAVMLAVVHLRGLFEADQPLVEDLEVLLYGGFAALAWWCKPSARDPRISPR
jgi:hypothetical protein